MLEVVEKLWKSLRETLWGSCGKVSTFCWYNKFYTEIRQTIHNSIQTVGSFTVGFTHKIIPVKSQFYTVSTHPITTTTKYLINRK